MQMGIRSRRHTYARSNHAFSPARIRGYARLVHHANSHASTHHANSHASTHHARVCSSNMTGEEGWRRGCVVPVAQEMRRKTRTLSVQVGRSSTKIVWSSGISRSSLTIAKAWPGTHVIMSAARDKVIMSGCASPDH